MHDGLLAARQRATGRSILIIWAVFGRPKTVQTMLPTALKARSPAGARPGQRVTC
jgi:hypothetical protein